jgi:hypothetical protein
MRWIARLTMGLTLCAISAAYAQSFDPVVQQARRVQLWAIGTIQGQDGASSSDFLYQFKQFPPEASFFGPYDVSDHLVLDIAAPDGTAAAHFDTTQSLTSFVGSERIEYEARVVASAATTGTPGPASTGYAGTVPSGPGNGAFFGMYFDVHTPISAVLTLHADTAGGGTFIYMLRDDITGQIFAALTASDTAPGGPLVAPEETMLLLQPSRYVMTAELTAHVPLNAQGDFTAGFALEAVAVAVPEAQTWAMLLVGFPLLGALARRARRRG